MKNLSLLITMTLASVFFISFLSHVNADTTPGPYVPPTKDLTEDQKRSLLQEAMSVPGVNAWSDKWQFSSVDYAGTEIPTPHWQTMTLRLYLPPNVPAPKSCSSGWLAFVVFDYATGKILDSVYPNSTSTCVDSNRILESQDPQMNVLSGESPLKQFKSGISIQNIQCNEGLQLVVKSEDDFPACVKLDTAYILIKRGWAASESAYPGGDAQFALDTNSTIMPAHMPRSSGGQIPYYKSSRVINYSGFDGVYNETFSYRGTQKDYVLKPGSTAIITFNLEAVASEQQGQHYPIPLPKSLNLTNYSVFYHEITSLEDLSKYPGVTFDDGSYGHFMACSTGPAGRDACIGGPFGGANPIEAFVTDHPGVDVLFEPPSEVLPLGMNATSQVVTMMITADSNASRGTYLVELPSIGLDSFLLTVGNQPYHE